ncbi:TrmH family RNA methyltransferase [Phormidium sp. CCY1219]|uniref:TrmH family RNA methyltransferase n=1 Tax=Phormidium sp. CCY1219 TaxID=2886104 RepID=UPI002D1F178F|nr:RNA methyltransferase [Phormidium sp. CCY1219]MEB3827501.1 RNA methyltransferase [Phormidium sp. CCY1219]
MQLQEKKALIAYLSQFATPARRDRIESVLNRRTRYLTLVLEDIYQTHNASAVLRNCDCFGIQDIHIVENLKEFTLNKDVSVGSERWLSVYRYRDENTNNTQHCLEKLKSEGYKIIATSPHAEKPLDELSIDEKLALLFGSEVNGLSDYALQNADEVVTIPIQGFSESFNISVSAALCLYHLTTRLRKTKKNWPLTEAEKIELRLNWLRKSVRHSENLEQKFFQN